MECKRSKHTTLRADLLGESKPASQRNKCKTRYRRECFDEISVFFLFICKTINDQRNADKERKNHHKKAHVSHHLLFCQITQIYLNYFYLSGALNDITFIIVSQIWGL